MSLISGDSLSLDDVLLVPQLSDVKSRREVSLRTKLSKNIEINLPIVSANMDTVTEEAMAVSMAMQGGIGIIHRFLDIADQADMVRRVKRRTHNEPIDNPYTIYSMATITDLRVEMKVVNVSSLIVVSSDRKCAGIITGRDLHCWEVEVDISNMNAAERKRLEDKTLVRDLMTPLDKLIYVEEGTGMAEAVKKMTTHRIEKLPYLDKEGHVKGVLTLRDVTFYQNNRGHSTLDNKGRFMVGAAVGVKPEDRERAAALSRAECDVFVIDIAHGHSDHTADMVKFLKKAYPHIDVIAGNVATAEGVKFLAEAGADAVKVNIGAGSICTTRIMTGCGVPQFTAVLNCAKAGRECGVPIISDGGNQGKIGNIVKALGAGASCVMLGNFLAGTDESPGKVLIKDGKKVKLIRGMASYGAHFSRARVDSDRETIRDRMKSGEMSRVINLSDENDVVPEGVEAYVNYKGSVKDILFQIQGGIRSGASYCGAHTISELHAKATFQKTTASGIKESGSHSVTTF
eukprot:CAMPEP_0113872076 /NCGR_PEP_ID=MMETSP0780_2-20120614/3000_1 /TAXON_ID=652834 /ORGANISM="Palpitomonas bilix" /LENGTH=514 /DNA_ID=CAMNT_0000857543 /DNA_START=43 /DNA_END=1587 /DNA_ORIENTATION=+ /assembly_acc=CAM_ASM_000599